LKSRRKETQNSNHFELKKEYIFEQITYELKMKSKKLSNKSIESFKIVRDIKKLSYELDLLKKMQIHLIFHAFMLQHCNQTISLQTTETPVELNKEYEIENILEKRMISEKAHYLVK